MSPPSFSTSGQATGAAGAGVLDLAEASAATGARLEGQPGWTFRRVVPLAQAGPGKLGFLADRGYLKHLDGSVAEAVLVSADLSSSVRDRVPNLLVTEQPRVALAQLLERLHPSPPARPGIHASAVLGRGVRLGKDVCIAAYAVLEEDVEVGDRVRIGAHVSVGRGSRIADDSELYPQVVLYPGTRLGRRVVLHAGTVAGSDGFGYVAHRGRHQKVRQVGGCRIGDDVEMGAHCCIDRGSIGDTVIGDGTKTDNLVHVAHNVTVGEHSLLIAQVGISGSTTLGRGVVMAGQSGATGHLEIGDGARVAVQTGVLRDVPAGTSVVGFPGRPRAEFWKSMAAMRQLPALKARVKRLEDRLAALENNPETVAPERATS